MNKYEEEPAKTQEPLPCVEGPKKFVSGGMLLPDECEIAGVKFKFFAAKRGKVVLEAFGGQDVPNLVGKLLEFNKKHRMAVVSQGRQFVTCRALPGLYN